MCRYWRESIISTPENWAIISDSRRNLAALNLERAKAAPLEIHFYAGRTQRNSQFLDLLTPYFQNTETLRIIDPSAIEDLFLFSQHPMTKLRSLTLLGSRVDRNRSIDPFQSSTYTLRYLELLQVPLYSSLLNLTTLTELNISDSRWNLHLDTFLDFLEGNSALTSAKLYIEFIEPSLRNSRPRTPIRNRLQYLRISCCDAMDGQALISGVALSKGAELELHCFGDLHAPVGVGDILSGIPTTHLSNLQSPTFMQYCGCPMTVKLHGPNGAASFHTSSDSFIPFVEFPLLPLVDIQRFHLDTYVPPQPYSGPSALHLSSFTALETFIMYHTDFMSLSVFLPNPATSRLKTVAFFNCLLSEEFMEALAQFASDRKNTTLTRLQRVVIVQERHQSEMFPSIASIRKLERHIPLVDVRIATELPRDL